MAGLKSVKGNASMLPVRKSEPARGKVGPVGKPPKTSSVSAFKTQNK